jgi:alpha-glucosidase
MTSDRIFGSIDRYWVDPFTGAHVLAGWASDGADPVNDRLVVRFIEHGVVIGSVVADLARDDGFHGFSVRCDGANLAARASKGAITAVAQADDGRTGSLIWHPPFLGELAAIADVNAQAPVDLILRADDRVTPGAVFSVRMLPDGIEVDAGAVHLRITAPREDIVRVRMAERPEWAEDVSWAVLDQARRGAATTRPLREDDAVGFATTRLVVRILRANGRILITRADGAHVCMDAEDFPPDLQRGGFTLRKQRLPGEHFFGLGDQPGPLDRLGGAFTLWNTDTGDYQEASSPVYKSVPFFIAARHGGACGILLDNSWRSSFDFCRTRRDVVAFGAEGGAADYYVLSGLDARAVLQSYAHLTGLPPLPPLWALGYHQSRYSYMTQNAVKQVADGLRAKGFPADAIHCDIDFQDRNRPFTVNKAAFPNFPGMVGALAARGLRTVAITDLHIATVTVGYAPYRSGLEGGHFVTTPTGEPYVGVSHPGPAVFPDFTRAETRQWWGGLYRGFVDAGVAGFWNDMNEPAVGNEPTGTMPLDTVHRVEEPGYPFRKATHAELHNVVGLENARATYEAVQAMRPDERPFVLTRASFAGGQRYGWTWTGDNSATWNHLRMTTPMLVNAGLSGISFIGADVGGFFGAPTPDLLTRWFQVGAFHPFFRNHCYLDSPPREPWLDGPRHEAIRRRCVEERYRLLPYFYTVAEEASRTGVPMLRPLFFECPSILGIGSMFNREPQSQFMLGAALMIAPPVFGEMLNSYHAALPDGPWFDYWTGRPIDAAEIALQPALEDLPVFVRAGSILPRQDIVQSTGQNPDGPLELGVYLGRDCSGSIYLDDGHSLAFQRGEFLRQSFQFAATPTGGEFHMSPREGTYEPWWETIELVVHGLPDQPYDVAAKRAAIMGVAYDHDRQALRVILTDPGGEDLVRILPKP